MTKTNTAAQQKYETVLSDYCLAVAGQAKATTPESRAAWTRVRAELEAALNRLADKILN